VWRGTGRWSRGEKGMGDVREVGVEGSGSWIPKVVGSGRNRGKLCEIAQSKKGQRDRSQPK